MIVLILLFAFVLRIINLGQSLWLDEAIGAIEIKKQDLPGLINNFLVVDNHTPLYYMLLDIWASIFGYSEVSLRMPSVLFGVGTVYLVYKIAQEVFPKQKSISYILALLMATSQFHIYFSGEARMYAMAGFFATLCVYAFIKLTTQTLDLFYWTVFSLSLAILIFTDYMPLFLWPVFPIYAIYKKLPRSWWKRFVISQIPLAIFSILWLPVLTTQISNYSTLLKNFSQWSRVAGGASLKNIFLVWTKFVFGRVSLVDKTTYYLLLAVSSIPYLIIFLLSFKQIKKYLLFFLWFALPLVFSLIASIVFPVFNYFRFVYILPAWFILIGVGLSQINKSWLKKLLVGLMLTFNFLGIYIYFSDQNQQREQWRQAMQFIDSQSNESSLAVFEFPEPFAPVRWYDPQIEILGATSDLTADPDKTQQKTKNAIINKNKIYYFEYLADLSDPERVVYQTLLDEGFIKKEEYGNFIGIGKITLFEKLIYE